MKRAGIGLVLAAAACLALTLLNASLLAPEPPGRLIVIAHRGTAQPVDPSTAGQPCPARHIRADAGHTYIENTIFSMRGALAYGGGGFALDIQVSADGHAMIFRDAALDCRTDGSGPVAGRPLAALKRLDVGHGYSADGGRTFPLRGRGVGAMPTAAEAIRAFADRPLIFTLHDPAAADAIVAAFGQARIPIADRHGFAGAPEALARLRALTGAGWLVDRRASEACLADYRRFGWSGIVPATCRGVTVIVPPSGGWTLWGWPYRFLDRMAGAGARTLMVADPAAVELAGLDQPDQLGEVPRHYHGMLLIDDMFDVGRSLGQ
jgi:glycerophosphoryl diester phosphodiesterase